MRFFVDKTRWFAIVLTVSLVVLAGCKPVTPAPTSQEAAPAASAAITAFAPSVLGDAVKQLGAGFEATQGDVKVQLEIGHTPTQRTQIEEGATPDVFFAAGKADIEALAQQNLIAADQIKPLARNQLIVVLPPDNPAGIAAVEDLIKPGVRLLLAQPELPIGMATEKLLDNLAAKVAPDFKEKALANVVSRELGVKPIVTKVALGEADAGVVFVSDATAAPELATLALPGDVNVTVMFMVAPLAAAADPEKAKAFVDYVLADEAQAMLQAQGFLSPAP